MCFPALAGLGPIFQGLGVAASVGGTLLGAKAQQNAAIASEQQNNNNAIIAERNAEDAANRGAVAENEVQLRTRARIGMQKNALSERSVAVNSGSALEILGDTAMFGKLDALTTRNNFQREAIAYKAQSSNFKAAAKQDSMTASNAGLAGGISAFSTALGGIGDISQRRQMRLN